MDNRPSLHCESIVVQMEEDDFTIRPPRLSDDVGKMERSWHPVLAVDESGSSRLKSFSHPREPPLAVTTASKYFNSLKRNGKTDVVSPNHRKLNTTARRQLRAEPLGARQSKVKTGVGIEKLGQGMESLRRTRCLSLTTVQSQQKSGRTNPNDAIIDFSGEGVRPDTPETESTHSETGISRNDDKVSTTTIGSRTSEESQEVRHKDRTSSSSSTGTMGYETKETDFINELWDTFETSWKWQTGITDEEKQNGYRFLHRIDESYLGFRPGPNDKREFLKAYPIVGPVPEARLGCNCSMPMTFAQWICVAMFFMIVAGLGVGGYFYFDKDSRAA